MAASDPLEILLKHNLWATHQLIDACEKLGDEQFHQQFEMGPGSLHDTVTHILGAMQGWCDMLIGREPRVRLEEEKRTVGQLRELTDTIASEFSQAAAAHDVDGIARASRGGRDYAFTRGGVLAHVMTHGMHHRAQCLNMLRQLGVEALPHSSVLEWMLFVDPVEPIE